MEHNRTIKVTCVHWQRDAKPFLKIMMKKGRCKLCFERGTELEDVEDGHTGNGIIRYNIS